MFNDSELYDKLFFNIKTMGAWMCPFDAYISMRGIKTLKLRVERAASNALSIAKFLENHPKIEKVFYPGLKTHPHYKIALKNRADPLT